MFTSPLQPKFLIAKGFWVVVFVFAAAFATAKPEFLSLAKKTLKFKHGGAIDGAACALCHVSAGPPALNPFGSSVHKGMASGSLNAKILESLLTQDPDGDGFTNAEEIAADTLPGDAKSHPKEHPKTETKGPEPENPFSLGSVLLAKNAQHPAIVHFPIALFVVSLVLDLIAWRKSDARLAWAGKLNLQISAGTSLITIATGLLAWQLKFGGTALTGNLLYHLIGGVTFGVLAWAMVGIRKTKGDPTTPALALLYFGAAIVALLAVVITGHLGGVLSGVAG